MDYSTKGYNLVLKSEGFYAFQIAVFLAMLKGKDAPNSLPQSSADIWKESFQQSPHINTASRPVYSLTRCRAAERVHLSCSNSHWAGAIVQICRFTNPVGVVFLPVHHFKKWMWETAASNSTPTHDSRILLSQCQQLTSLNCEVVKKLSLLCWENLYSSAGMMHQAKVRTILFQGTYSYGCDRLHKSIFLSNTKNTVDLLIWRTLNSRAEWVSTVFIFGHLNYEYWRDVQQIFSSGFKKTLAYPDIPTMFALRNSPEKEFICQITSVSDSWSGLSLQALITQVWTERFKVQDVLCSFCAFWLLAYGTELLELHFLREQLSSQISNMLFANMFEY